MKRFTVQPLDLNNYLTLLPGLYEINNMTDDKSNKILLHSVPNRWKNQACIQGWGFNIN